MKPVFEVGKKYRSLEGYTAEFDEGDVFVPNFDNGTLRVGDEEFSVSFAMKDMPAYVDGKEVSLTVNGDTVSYVNDDGEKHFDEIAVASGSSSPENTTLYFKTVDDVEIEVLVFGTPEKTVRDHVEDLREKAESFVEEVKENETVKRFTNKTENFFKNLKENEKLKDFTDKVEEKFNSASESLLSWVNRCEFDVTTAEIPFVDLPENALAKLRFENGEVFLDDKLLGNVDDIVSVQNHHWLSLRFDPENARRFDIKFEVSEVIAREIIETIQFLSTREPKALRFW